jgi:hypothetical protein
MMPVREGGWLAGHPFDEARDFRMRPQAVDRVEVIAQFLFAQHGMDLGMADPVQSDRLGPLVGARNEVMQVHAWTRHQGASAQGTDIGVRRVQGGCRYAPGEGAASAFTQDEQRTPFTARSIRHPW